MFGLTALEIRLAGYALALAAVLGGYMYWHHSVMAEGATKVETKYVIRDAGALKAANDRIQALQTQYRAAEQSKAQAMADISKTYQERLNAQARSIAQSNIRLFDVAAKPAASCVGGLPEAAAGAPGRDGGAELSAAASGFLQSLTARCDAQVAAAQAVIEADRK